MTAAPEPPQISVSESGAKPSTDGAEPTASADSSNETAPAVSTPQPSLKRRLRQYRQRSFMLLAANRSPMLISALGLLSGVIVGAVMIGFESAVALLQVSAGLREADDFTPLPAHIRLSLPIIGAIIIGVFYRRLNDTDLQQGVPHVIERLERHDGNLPAKNALAHGLGAITAIASGFSVGREGPGVHLGAAANSQTAGWLGLPANATRILVACGAAAAIAASFNTPLAGVIFAMEVILMEYSVAGFVPIMLSAVSATAMTQLFHGNEPTFNVPGFSLGSLWELPWIALTAAAIGALAAFYVKLMENINQRSRNISIFKRMLLAGVITAACGLVAPEVMGIGYQGTNQALVGNIAISTAALILLAKLLASSAALGLGIPGGLIGPTIVMGAMAGVVFGGIGGWISPNAVSPMAFYALLGMGTMMAATLQAPLAALVAMLELTANPNVIMPGMLSLMVAYLTSQLIFRHEPVFLRMLMRSGMPVKHDPRVSALQQSTVAANMNTSVRSISAQPSLAELRSEAFGVTWLLLRDQGRLMRSKELKSWLELKDFTARDQIDLMQAPVPHLKCAAIPVGASLYRALLHMRGQKAQALYASQLDNGEEKIIGILTEDAVTGKLII